MDGNQQSKSSPRSTPTIQEQLFSQNSQKKVWEFPISHQGSSIIKTNKEKSSREVFVRFESTPGLLDGLKGDKEYSLQGIRLSPFRTYFVEDVVLTIGKKDLIIGHAVTELSREQKEELNRYSQDQSVEKKILHKYFKEILPASIVFDESEKKPLQ